MPTAWELLIENSAAISGSTAWEHLNAQTGGGAAGDVYVAEMVSIVDDDQIMMIEDSDAAVVIADDDLSISFDLDDSDVQLILDDNLGVNEL